MREHDVTTLTARDLERARREHATSLTCRKPSIAGMSRHYVSKTSLSAASRVLRPRSTTSRHAGLLLWEFKQANSQVVGAGFEGRNRGKDAYGSTTIKKAPALLSATASHNLVTGPTVAERLLTSLFYEPRVMHQLVTPAAILEDISGI